MRFSYASMALSFAIISTMHRFRMRCITSAFIPQLQSVSFSSSRDPFRVTGSSPGFRSRRARPQVSSDTLLALVTDLHKCGKLPTYSGGALSATVEKSDMHTKQDEQQFDPIFFPQKGRNIEDSVPRMRFAPSPTGSLHVGGARTALYNWLTAKKGQLENPEGDGAFILRIEDTDVARSTKASEDSVIADLKWLGILWDEGPDDPKAPYGPYRQSERSEIYKRVAEKLINEGHAYPCFCTMDELDAMKAKQEADGVPPRYDGTWRDADPSLVQKKLDEGAEYTIRFKVPPGARIVIEDAVRGTVSWDADATIGDFILLRSSGVPVYNFCVAVDDALMGVTTVIRAEEHLTNTVRQCLILDALGAPRPRYAHCSLILGEDKQKLSKRHGATSCNQFRIDGFLPDAMINYLALLGWNDGTDNEIFTREELIEAFDVNRVVKSPSIFDMAKLKWVNQQHMKMKTVEQLVTLVYDQLNYLNLFNENANEQSKKDFAYAATYLSKQMMETTRDGATNAKKVLSFALPATFDELIDKEAKDMVSEGSFYDISQRIINDYENGRFPQPDPSDPLAAFRDSDESKLRDAPSVSFPDAYKTYMKHLAKDFNLKGKQLFHPVRLALTGEMSGQDVTKQLALVVMACQENGAVNIKNADVVSLNERMERLKSFCATIPSELRVFKKTEQAQVEDRKKSAKEVPVKVTEISEIPSNSLASNESSTDIIDSYQGHPITALDIRVGRILKVWEHTEADKLYCEEIDVGESQPRMIASGLRPYMKMDDMVGRLVCVLCNLKERKLVGFPSHGMVLCASNKDHTEVKFVSPPVDAKVGERVTVPGFNFSEESGKPYTENVMGKKKVFEDLAPFLVTSKYGIPEFLGRPFVTSAGVCTSPIADGSVS